MNLNEKLMWSKADKKIFVNEEKTEREGESILMVYFVMWN